MRRYFCLVSTLLLALAFVSGCGDNNEDFVFTTPQGNPTRPIRVQNVLARTIPTTITTITAFGLDSADGLVYGPDARTPDTTMVYQVPLNVVEFRLAYQNANGDVVGVYQTDVPSGTTEFVINDPDFVDLDDFVESLAATPANVTLDVGVTEAVVVTATLSDGSTADVSQFVTTSSQNPAIATTTGVQFTGAASGSTSVTVALFNVSTSVPVSVNDLISGLISSPDGTTPADGDTFTASISNDGRYVAFESVATNLIANGTSIEDVYVLDRVDGSIRIVSNRSNGDPSQAGSDGAQISGNGRFVIFQSSDSLVTEDTNGVRDAYLYDLQTSTLELLSVNEAGTASGNGVSDLYGGTITDDGRFVLFQSAATDLTSFNDTNGFRDVFLRDRQSGTTEIISISTNDTQGNNSSSVYLDGISQDGRFVTFYTDATNLDSAVTDSNNTFDSLLRDRTNGTTTYISKAAGTNNAADGGTYVTWMSNDGSQIIVSSDAPDLVSPSIAITTSQLFLYTRLSDSFELLTDDNQGGFLGGQCYEGQLSADGRFLLFVNQGDSTLDPSSVSQTVMRDRNTGEYRVVSSTAGGNPTTEYSYVYSSAMTPDGRYVVFESSADDLSVQSVVSSFTQVYASLNPFL